MNGDGQSDWFEDYVEDTEESQVEEYDITATPNDFNVMTLHSFIESGAIRIPVFQRNFVWDLRRSSRLIESLILGLPVPQLFLYEQARNKFLVIDGQQRLMSIYYFIKQRFPRKEKSVELRSIFDHEGSIPNSVFYNDKYFRKFNLQLPNRISNHKNRFNGLNYSTMEDYKEQLDLRPIRNIIIKQNIPSDDHSSMYEVFNRLNTGGTNLHPQEIRMSMYHSDFYNMLYLINKEPAWRLKILLQNEPDLHMRDIESILRGFAMLIDGSNYAPSMVKFLNQFSKKCEKHSREENEYLQNLFGSFLKACSDLPEDAFFGKKNKRFNLALYEAVFTATCEKAFAERRPVEGTLDIEHINTLESDQIFVAAAQKGTTQTANVKDRLNRAREIIGTL